MNKWGYEQKYKRIKESLALVDRQLEGLQRKKAQLLEAKLNCREQIRKREK